MTIRIDDSCGTLRCYGGFALGLFFFFYFENGVSASTHGEMPIFYGCITACIIFGEYGDWGSAAVGLNSCGRVPFHTQKCCPMGKCYGIRD